MPKKEERKPIDQTALEKMAEKGWTVKEIAASFHVDPTTIYRRYATLIEECRQRGTAKVRDLQWQRALQGSDKMILHMSKHLLGQHDKIEASVSSTTQHEIAPAVVDILSSIRDDLKAWLSN